MTAWFELARWHYDEDDYRDVGHFHLRVSDGANVAAQEFYARPAQLEEFAVALDDFPKGLSHQVALEIGAKDEAHWVWLKAILYDASGRAALLVDVGSGGHEAWAHQAQFAIRCEAASLNQLGRALGTWSRGEGRTHLHQELHGEG